MTDKVTVSQVYELVDRKQKESNDNLESLRKEMTEGIKELSTKIDAYVLTAALKIDLDKTSRKVEKLENFKWQLTGFGIGLVFLVNIFADTIKHFFGFR